MVTTKADPTFFYTYLSDAELTEPKLQCQNCEQETTIYYSTDRHPLTFMGT
jgi:hypothetical protein